jgi:TP901 family phage tail tape measure protein
MWASKAADEKAGAEAYAATIEVLNAQIKGARVRQQEALNTTLVGIKGQTKQMWADKTAEETAAVTQFVAKMDILNAQIKSAKLKQQEALESRAYAQVKAATFNPVGSYSTISSGTLNAVKNSDLDMNMPSKAMFLAAQAQKELNEHTEKGVKPTQLLTAEKAKLSAQMRELHSATRGLASGFGAMWLTWGSILPLMAGAAVSNAIVQTVKLGASVDDTFTRMRVLTDESAASTQRLNDQMLKLATTGPFGPAEIADAMKLLALSGQDAAEVGASIKDVLNFSVAGEVIIKTAADTLTTVATAFKIGADGFGYVGDVVAKAAAISKSSVEDMSSAMKTASVVNSLYGVSLNETAVGISLLANAGIKGAAAGTALRNVYVDLTGRTKKVRDELTALGVETLDPLTGKVRNTAAVFKDLLLALSEKRNPIDATRAMENIFTERSMKEAIAVVDALRTKADESAKSTISVYDDMMEQVTNSASFAAAAAAEIALTPLNQMKAVIATLQATFVEAFGSMQPYMVETAAKLREVFSSEGFKSALKDLVALVGTLTTFVAEHLRTITQLVVGYMALKGVATALAELRLAWVAVTAAEVAAAEGAAAVGVASRLAMAANPLLLALGAIVTAAAGAWILYKTYSSEAKDATESGFSTQNALIDNLRSETQRLNEVNEARSKGITLKELEAGKSAGRTADDFPEVKAAQKAYDEIRSKLQTANYAGIGTGYRSVDVQKERDALVKLNLVRADANRLLVAEEFARNELRWAANRNRADAEAEAEEKRRRTVLGTPGLPSVAETSSEKLSKLSDFHGKELEMIKSRYSSELSVISAAESGQQKLLAAQRQALIIADGQFYAQELAVARGAEAQKLQVIDGASAKYQTAYTKRYNDVIAASAEYVKANQGKTTWSADKEAQEASRLASELDKLSDSYDEFFAKQNDERSKIENGAFVRMQLQAIAAQGEINKLAKEAKDFWALEDQRASKVVRQTALEDQLRYASPEARAWISATASEQERLNSLIQDHQNKIDLLQVSADYYASVVGPRTEEEAALEKQVNKVLADRIKLRDELKGKAPALVDTAGQRALDKQSKDTAAKLRDDVSGAIETALFEGGEQGATALRSIIVKKLREPVTLVVNAMVNAAMNGVSGALGFGSGAAGGAGGVGSGAAGASIYAGASSFGTAASWMSQDGFSTGVGEAFNSAGTAITRFGDTLNATGTGTISEFGNSMAANSKVIGEYAGNVGTALSYLSALNSAGQGKWGEAIGTAVGTYYFGPIGAAVGKLIGGMVDTAFGDSGTQKTGGVYSMGAAGSNVTLTAKQASGLEFPQQMQTVVMSKAVSGIDALFKSIGSKATVSAFQAGAETGGNKGEAYSFAGGTLSTGQKFGDTANANLSDLWNKGQWGEANAKDTFQHYIDEMSAVTLEALQAATDVPKVIADTLQGVDIEQLTTSEVSALTQTISKIVEDTTLLRVALDALQFKNLKDISFDTASTLISMAGGLDNFKSALNSYYENFYNSTEKSAQSLSNVGNALRAAGLELTDQQISGMSRQQYRDLVDAQDVTTESGKKTYLALIGVSGAFAEITPVAKDTARTLEQITSNLESLQKTGAQLAIDLQAITDPSGAAKAQRTLDTAGLTQAEIDQYDTNSGIKKQIDAANTRKDLLAELDTLTLTEIQQTKKLRDETIATLNELDDTGGLANLQQQVWDLSDAADAAAGAAKNLNDKLSLQAQIYKLSKDTAGSELVLQQQRSLQIKDLLTQDPSGELARLTLTMWDLQDAADAAEGSTKALSAAESAQSKYQSAMDKASGIRDQATSAYLAAQDKVASAQQAIADAAIEAARKMDDLGTSLQEFVDKQLGVTRGGSNFNALARAAQDGDTTALSKLADAAQTEIDKAKNTSGSYEEYSARRGAILSQVQKAATLAKERAAPELAKEVSAEAKRAADLISAQKEMAEALRVANAIGAPLTESVDDLISKYNEALGEANQAKADALAATNTLNDIKKNTGDTAKNVDSLKLKLQTELTVKGTEEIAKLVRLTVNTDGLDAGSKGLLTGVAQSATLIIGMKLDGTPETLDALNSAKAATTAGTKVVTLALESEITPATLTTIAGAVLQGNKNISLSLTGSAEFALAVSGLTLDGNKNIALSLLPENEAFLAGVTKATAEINKIVSLALKDFEPGDAAVLLAAATGVTKTITAALGASDEAALAVAVTQTETITKTLRASGGVLTDDQRALINGITLYNKEIWLTVKLDEEGLTQTQASLKAAFGTIDLGTIGTGNAGGVIGQTAAERLASIKTYVETLDWGTVDSQDASSRALAPVAKQYGVTMLDLANAMGQGYEAVAAMFAHAGIPKFAKGTNFVPNDMFAQIHKGEAIIPAAFNPERYSRASGNDALVMEIKALREEVSFLRSEQRAGHGAIASNTRKTHVILSDITQGGSSMQVEGTSTATVLGL